VKLTLSKTKVLGLRLKHKHAKFLRDLAREVNFVWNYCNELQITMFNRERRFLSGYDFAKFTRGATKEGLHLHSQTVQAIAEEYADSCGKSLRGRSRPLVLECLRCGAGAGAF
jgi:putative transposase